MFPPVLMGMKIPTNIYLQHPYTLTARSSSPPSIFSIFYLILTTASVNLLLVNHMHEHAAHAAYIPLPHTWVWLASLWLPGERDFNIPHTQSARPNLLSANHEAIIAFEIALSWSELWSWVGDATCCVHMYTNSSECHSRGSASLRSSLLPLFIEEVEDILCTWVCLFCSSTTDEIGGRTKGWVSIIGGSNDLVSVSFHYSVDWYILVEFYAAFMLYTHYKLLCIYSCCDIYFHHAHVSPFGGKWY